jgi:hypothetical protein
MSDQDMVEIDADIHYSICSVVCQVVLCPIAPEKLHLWAVAAPRFCMSWRLKKSE